MRYTRLLRPGEQAQWLNLGVTVGSDESWIAPKAHQLNNFLSSFDQNDLLHFKEISVITDTDLTELTIHNRETLMALLLKLFVDGIGISILKEADPELTGELPQIYLTLSERMYHDSIYPTHIYIHAMYRRRGTPKTWLTLDDAADATEVAQILESKIRSLVKYVNLKMVADRKFRQVAEIDQQLIFVLTKSTGPKVALSVSKNVEVSSASHTFIVFNKRTSQIGVVSGAHKEIGFIHIYLRYKLFRNQLAPRRSEQMADGNEVVMKLIEHPEPNDALSLKTLEVRNAHLPAYPTLRISAQSGTDLTGAASQLRAAWQDSELSDIKHLEYIFRNKSIGLYCTPDPWDRVVINTKSGSVTNELEDSFLDIISERLGGINIKTTKLILAPYETDYILSKFLGQKSVAIDQAIPQAAEEMLLTLIKQRLVYKPTNAIKRQCFHCHAVSWESMICPACDHTDMRIIGESMSVSLNENQLLAKLHQSLSGRLSKMVTYIRKRQRSNYPKTLIAIDSEIAHSTIFLVYVADQKDVAFIDELATEGFGIVAIIDPKMETAQETLSSIDVDNVGLIELLSYLLSSTSAIEHPLSAAIQRQHERMLARIISRAQTSMQQILNKPTGYLPTTFEIDLKNLFQALVPDVVRLGTEHSGQKVPDGYLRYGLQGTLTNTRRGRLFGWDAKYSHDLSYRLGGSDARKQKGYIDWLADPKGIPHQFGSLGIYAIVANFSSEDQFETVMASLSAYTKLPRTTRIVVIEDLLLARIIEWSLEHWEQVLVNNGQISKLVFGFFRRKSSKSYTVSGLVQWPKLKKKLDTLITS